MGLEAFYPGAGIAGPATPCRSTHPGGLATQATTPTSRRQVKFDGEFLPMRHCTHFVESEESELKP